MLGTFSHKKSRHLVPDRCDRAVVLESYEENCRSFHPWLLSCCYLMTSWASPTGLGSVFGSWPRLVIYVVYGYKKQQSELETGDCVNRVVLYFFTDRRKPISDSERLTASESFIAYPEIDNEKAIAALFAISLMGMAALCQARSNYSGRGNR